MFLLDSFMESKIYELADLKGIAIILLFFVHSNLQVSAYVLSVELQ